MSPSLLVDELESTSFSRPTWVEIDLEALRSNLHALQTTLGPAQVLAVVKANAYGHGAVPIAHTLLAPSSIPPVSPGRDARAVDMLGVASVDEGLQLREAGISVPILLLSAILPGEARTAVRNGLLPTVFTREVALALNEAGAAEHRVAEAHLKIDTGMGRLGVWHQEAAAFYHWLRALPHLRISGIYTHFACADAPDDAMTEAQARAFEVALRECGDLSGMTIHGANSAAALRYPQARWDMVRPGLTLYGVSPLREMMPVPVELRPVMTFKSRITHIKTVPAGATVSYGATWQATQPTRIATVPVGYADGYPRRLSNRAKVFINDVCCSVVGRVTMDQILVDCTHLGVNPQVGDNVTLFGAGLPVQDVAAWAETIPYEILCGIAHRVPRVYLHGGAQFKRSIP
ncbi:MAG: alanine racemase [Abitibacteriaceae bacterium]|nr:alanine racemase [Abditibacteriaceae bacterium]